MGQPTVHVLTVLELLQTHQRLNGAEIARRLDVSVRTVRRYMLALQELGVPITSEPGRSGAYSLVGGFKLPPSMRAGISSAGATCATRCALFGWIVCRPCAKVRPDF
jgi:biotin operon repressor